MLPGIDGEALLDFLEETQPKYLRRVIVTTASPGKMSCEFLQRICRLLTKPFDIDELVLIARECAQPDPAAAGDTPRREVAPHAFDGKLSPDGRD